MPQAVGDSRDDQTGIHAVRYRHTAGEDELNSILDLEYREWMTRITQIFRERDERINELRREAGTRANPEGALDGWRRPVRLEALRRAVQSRLELRAEYAGRNPELLSEPSLSGLRDDMERFVWNAIKGDQRSVPEAGDILAAVRVGIEKLALHRSASILWAANVRESSASAVFVSYSWETEQHRKWVLELATRLRTEGGINIILDRWHLELGARLPEFMERAVRDSDFVLVVCTEDYKSRFDNRIGGAGYEGNIITSEIISEVGKNKGERVLTPGEEQAYLNAVC